MHSNLLFKSVISIFFLFILSACGGGGGEGEDNSPPERETTLVSGFLFNAPIAGAVVTAWEYKNGQIGKKLGESTTSSSGSFSMNINSGPMPILVQALGGVYKDPVTGNEVTAGDSQILQFEASTYFNEGNENKVMLTPLTYMAKGLADYYIGKGSDAKTAIETANLTISNMYGFDVHLVEPIDIVRGGDSASVDDGHKYGAYITSYSFYAADIANKYSAEEGNNIYTSYTLADIFYRDIKADGYFDGFEIDSISGLSKPISFGKEAVSRATYSNTLAQYLLITVNNDLLNISGTDSEGYQGFAEIINTLGNEVDVETYEVFSGRSDIELDNEAPTVSRADTAVLVGSDSLVLSVQDNIGTKLINVSLTYKMADDDWVTMECTGSHCEVDEDAFIKGARENTVPIVIHTLELDDTIADAKLLISVEDILGNINSEVYEIPFKWDNDAPVVVIESEDAFNPSLGFDYILKGYIKEEFSEIEVSVSVNNKDPQQLECNFSANELGDRCVFQENFSEDSFESGLSTFLLIVIDGNGNKSETLHEVKADTTKPNQVVSYPVDQMSFIEILNNIRQETITVYNADSFLNIDLNNKFLNIPYRYGAEGITSINYENFNPADLNTDRVPFIKVRVFDPIGASGDLGTSADKLVLRVDYLAIAEGYPSGANTVLSSNEKSIPHEKINYDETGYAQEVIYYIPYTKDIFGSGFESVTENHEQDITISTTDGSGNTTPPFKFSFRTTFNLPEIKVITPFINALVNFEVYTDAGDINKVGASCKTVQQPLLSDANTLASDVASCSINSEYVGEVIKVSLTSDSTSTFYNQGSRETKATVALGTDSGFSAYVLLDGAQNVYITELSVYQSSFFEYLWNEEKSKEPEDRYTAKEILVLVNDMLTAQNSLLGFNPVTTPYTTNEGSDNNTSTTLSESDQHRAVLESLLVLSDNSPVDSSVDFAEAFHDDFSFDGIPNGQSKDGAITLGNYSLSAETYRSELASIYYDYLIGPNGPQIKESAAIIYADQYATANPIFNGRPIFEASGSSIDVFPPTINLTPITGNYIELLGQLYIAGSIQAELLLQDPSGIAGSYAVDGLANSPVFNPSWSIDSERAEETEIAQLIFTPGSDNDQFSQGYSFDFNSESIDYTDIYSFNLDVSVADIHGNNDGFTSMPYSNKFVVDNDAPTFEYHPPFEGLAGYDADTYLNLNTKLDLAFNVSDVVGDNKEVRQIILTKDDEPAITLTKEDFYVNTNEQLVVSLCKSTVCDESDVVVDLKDGEWIFAIEGEDVLGNKLRAEDVTAPKYILNIDSSTPQVTTGTGQKFLGGNQKWNPNSVIQSGTLSVLQDMKIRLTRPGSSVVDLVECSVENGESCDDLPAYLTGTAPDYQVQLVAEHFEHGVDNTFKITAINNAYPSNSGNGDHTFKVDKNGPRILLVSPPLIDTSSSGNNVMGRNFTIQVANVTDDSAVGTVSVFQEKNDGTRVSIKESISVESPENPFSITLRNEETDRIQLNTGSNLVDLVVEASDEFGFTSKTNKIGMIYDTKGPSIALTNYSSSEYYRANFIFNLNAVDLSLTGDASTSGVNSSTVRYWVYTGNAPSESDAGTPPPDNAPNSIPLNASNTVSSVNLQVIAQDVRGNESLQVPFVININEAAPDTTLSMIHSDGTVIDNNTATQKKDIKLILKVEDKSGIASIASSYKLENVEGSNTINFSQTIDPTIWEAIIIPNVDGTYLISATVTSNTKANTESEILTSEINRTLMVQTEGVELNIATPVNFVTHISNKEMNVTFEKVNEGNIKTLECWVRENYTDEGVPADKSDYAIYNEPQNPICAITLDKNFLNSPVLITRTVGTNLAEKVQKFSFSLVDVEAPYIKDQAGYILQKSDVTFDAETGVKRLQLDIEYIDLHSNLDFNSDPISNANADSSGNPILRAVTQSGTEFNAVSCEQSTNDSALVRCTYTGEYSAFIDGLNTNHYVKANGVKDKAGNTIESDETTFELIIPTGEFTSNITGIMDKKYINGVVDAQEKGFKFNFELKVKLFEESSIENVEVTFAGTSHSFADGDESGIKNATVCADEITATCFAFEGVVPDSYISDRIDMRLTATVTDVWGNTASSVRDVLLDTVAPTIGEAYQLSPGETEDKVRVTFNIFDNISGSGLNNVVYNTSGIDFDFETTKTTDFTYIDIDKDSIGDKDEISVSISATDDVGLTTTKQIILNVSKPELTLTMTESLRLPSNRIALKERQQNFMVDSVPTASITMKALTLTLKNDVNEFSQNVDFIGDSGTGQFRFNDNQQGEYTLTLVATDSIGRDIASFTYDNVAFSVMGANTYVDFVQPTIGIITGEQITPLPTDGFYGYEVKATIQDANLKSVASTLTVDGTSYSPIKIIKPISSSDPYIFHYVVPAGDYAVSVSAEDFLDQSTNSTSTINVAEATVPGLTITSSVNDLGSERTAIITFKFSEEVVNFTKEDVIFSVDDLGATGTLDTSTWSDGPAKEWTAIYTAPKEENKTVTISVAEGSYTSTITVPGLAAEKELSIHGILPTVLNVVFDPIHSDNLTTVNVSVDFSSAVSDVKASLLATDVKWTSGQNTNKWVGSIVVPASVEDQLALVISEHNDTYKNVGKSDSNTGVLYLTPSITINAIPNVINGNDAGDLILSGETTRFTSGTKITVTVSNLVDINSDTKIVTVSSGGSWTTEEINLSRWADGTIIVKATGTNQYGIPVESVAMSAKLSTIKPTVTSIVSNKQFGEAGDKIGVTINFSVEVSDVVAQLGNSSVIWDTDKASKTWIGEVTLPNAPDETELIYTISGFRDADGNVGNDVLDSVVYLTPSISVDVISGGLINSSNLTNVVVSGQTTRFDNTTTVALLLSNSVDKQTKTESVSVQSDGSWTMPSKSLTGWPDSEVTATITGSNQHGVAAKAARGNAQLSTKPTISSVTLDPVNPSNGDNVQVTINFNKSVSNVAGSLGQEIDFSSVTAPERQWIGIISTFSVSTESEKDLIILANYEDAVGNLGKEYSTQVQVTPVIVLDVTAGDDVVGADDSNRFIITGTSTGFSEEDNLEVTVQSVNNPSDVFNEDVKVRSDGSWSTILRDVSQWDNSAITITIEGENSSNISVITINKAVTVDNTIASVDSDSWLSQKAA